MASILKMEEHPHSDSKHGVFVGIKEPGDSNRFVLVKHKYGERKWGLPGGGVRQGEPPIHGSMREALEEANVHIVKPKLVGIFPLRVRYEFIYLYKAVMWQGVPYVGPDNPEIEAVQFASIKEIDPEEIYTPQLSLLMILTEHFRTEDEITGYLTVPPTIITI